MFPEIEFADAECELDRIPLIQRRASGEKIDSENKSEKQDSFRLNRSHVSGLQLWSNYYDVH